MIKKTLTAIITAAALFGLNANSFADDIFDFFPPFDAEVIIIDDDLGFIDLKPQGGQQTAIGSDKIIFD